jgi:ABC-type molybdate transport system substrate-binding protein
MRLPLLAAAAVLALAVAGCSDDSTPPASTGGNQPNSAAPAADKDPTCALVPASLVNSVVGSHFADPSEQTNGSVVVCTYTGDHTMIIRIETKSSADAFAAAKTEYAKHNLSTKDLAGFADEAYTSTISAVGVTTNTLVARKGSTEILISSGLSIDQLKQLETKLFTVI